jgi:hypothetical protein
MIRDLGKKELQRYSVQRVIDRQFKGMAMDGLEKELSDEADLSSGGRKAEGCIVPWEIFAGKASRRDLSVGTFGAGGALVGLDIREPIDVLRNKTVCLRLGAQVLSGLSSNCAIPRVTGTVTAQALPESATLTKSTPVLDQILLVPHRVGAWCDFSRQLLLQASLSVEGFVRNDILRTLGVKYDYLMLQGAGANSEPTGILNTAGIGSLTFGGGATWAQILAFEKSLGQANADTVDGRFGYATTPNVRAKWKGVPKIGSTFPVFFWEDLGDGSADGKVNGYRATASNQILADAVVFGNWMELVFAFFGAGPDLMSNPYSRDTDGVVRVTANSYIDVAVRHAPSFCWSADSGAQ